MSSLSMATVALLCCACTQVNEAAKVQPITNKPSLRFKRDFICSSAVDVQGTSFFTTIVWDLRGVSIHPTRDVEQKVLPRAGASYANVTPSPRRRSSCDILYGNL